MQTVEQPVVDGWLILGRTADVVTLLAILITLAGLAIAYFTRAKVTETTYSSTPTETTYSIRNIGGRPAGTIFYRPLGLTSHGLPSFGDGSNPWIQSLQPGEAGEISMHDRVAHQWSGDPRPNQIWQPYPEGGGVVIHLTWRSSRNPLRTVHRVLIQQHARPVRILKGRAARHYASSVMSAGPGEPASPELRELIKSSRDGA